MDVLALLALCRKEWWWGDVLGNCLRQPSKRKTERHEIISAKYLLIENNEK